MVVWIVFADVSKIHANAVNYVHATFTKNAKIEPIWALVNFLNQRKNGIQMEFSEFTIPLVDEKKVEERPVRNEPQPSTPKQKKTGQDR